MLFYKFEIFEHDQILLDSFRNTIRNQEVFKKQKDLKTSVRLAQFEYGD